MREHDVLQQALEMAGLQPAAGNPNLGAQGLGDLNGINFDEMETLQANWSGETVFLSSSDSLEDMPGDSFVALLANRSSTPIEIAQVEEVADREKEAEPEATMGDQEPGVDGNDERVKSRSPTKTTEGKRARSRSRSSSKGREGPLECPHCSSVFLTQMALNGHAKKHGRSREEKKCHECKHIFENEGHYHFHMKYGHQKEWVRCDLCGMMTPCLNTMTNHLLAHEELKPQAQEILKHYTVVRK